MKFTKIVLLIIAFITMIEFSAAKNYSSNSIEVMDASIIIPKSCPDGYLKVRNMCKKRYVFASKTNKN